MPHNSKTSKQQTFFPGLDQSTSSQEASHASRTATQESGKGLMTSATNGRKCLEQFRKLSHASWWVKTFLASLVGMEAWYSSRCELTWKQKATKYNRYYCQLLASMPRTEGSGRGLLPTPDCSDRRSDRSSQWGLTNYAKNGLLPTPRANEWKGCGPIGSRSHNHMLQRDYLDATVQEMAGKTSQLNPRFVAEMMGFPPNWTELPFQSGEKNPSKDTETQ